MTIYQPIRKRGGVLIALPLVLVLGSMSIGATYASPSKTTVQDGNSVTSRSVIGMEFTSDGRINADVSPGAPVQTFTLNARNVGNIRGQVAYTVNDPEKFEFSDGALDSTVVDIQMNEDYGSFQVTLREFINSAFVADQVLPETADWKMVVQFRPVSTAANWTNADMGVFEAQFDSALTFTATDAQGSNEVLKYAEEHGKLEYEYNGAGHKKFWSIPASKLAELVQDDPSTTTATN